ncbi:MAG: hypothetical protein EOP24_45415 [Hyphomicrobiales bacterium]|nr:MAG: hypothetical protein EOP24_45415 [Hyphomicrobiales bacterium]
MQGALDRPADECEAHGTFLSVRADGIMLVPPAPALLALSPQERYFVVASELAMEKESAVPQLE